jgi:oligosaccharide repeat unit polymerase
VRTLVGLVVTGCMICIVTIFVLVAAENLAFPEFVFFGIFAFVPPLVVITRQLTASAPLDILSPYVLFPLTMGVVYIRAPELLRLEGQQGAAATVSRALLLGVLSYYLGVLVWKAITSRVVAQGRLAGSSDWRTGPIIAAYLVGVASMVAFWARAGGVPILMGDLENSRVAALTGSGVPFYLSMLLMVSCWLVLEPSVKISTNTKILMFVFGALLLATTGWRNTVFALLVVAVLVRHYRRPLKSSVLIMTGLAAMLGAVVIGLYRVISSGIETYLSYQQIARGDLIGATGTYLLTYADAFARNLATVFKVVPNGLDFQNGKTFVWNFLSLAPSSDLEPFDFVLKQAAGEGFQGGGLPPTLVGEWYLNFSWIGVVLGMAIVGAISAAAHHVASSSRSSVSRLLAILVAYYLFVSVRGGLGNVLLTATWLAIAVVVVARLSNAKDPRNSGVSRTLQQRPGTPRVRHRELRRPTYG